MLTIQEFASKINRSTQTVRFWLDKGFLKRKKFSGSLYFTENDIETATEIKKEMRKNKIEAMRWGKNEK